MNYINEHPLKSWRVRIMLGTVWITSALISFIPIYTNFYTTKEQAHIIDMLDTENGQCAMIVSVQYRYISSVVSFWLPGLGMIIFYGLVMKKAYYLEMHEFKKYKAIYTQIATGNNNNKRMSDQLTESKSKRNSSNITNDITAYAGSQTGLRQSGRNSTDAVIKGWKREYKVDC